MHVESPGIVETPIKALLHTVVRFDARKFTVIHTTTPVGS